MDYKWFRVQVDRFRVAAEPPLPPPKEMLIQAAFSCIIKGGTPHGLPLNLILFT